MKQVSKIAFWGRYNELFGGSPLRPREIHGKSHAELAKLVAERIISMRTSFSESPGESWEGDFVKACQEKEDKLKKTWEEEWPKLCDGKQLIRDLHEEVGFKESLIRLKIRVIKGMEDGKTELFKEVESKLGILLQ